MPISILPLSRSDLLLALLNGIPEFHQLFCLCLRIKHVRDGSVSWNSPDGGLYARVGTLFSDKQRDAGRGMNTDVVGELS